MSTTNTKVSSKQSFIWAIKCYIWFHLILVRLEQCFIYENMLHNDVLVAFGREEDTMKSSSPLP